MTAQHPHQCRNRTMPPMTSLSPSPPSLPRPAACLAENVAACDSRLLQLSAPTPSCTRGRAFETLSRSREIEEVSHDPYPSVPFRTPASHSNSASITRAPHEHGRYTARARVMYAWTADHAELTAVVKRAVAFTWRATTLEPLEPTKMDAVPSAPTTTVFLHASSAATSQ